MRRLPLSRALGALLLLAAGCSRPASTTPPPAGEFLVAGGDSTYWVQASASGLRLRGSPITLARFDDRFYEVYVTDDDRSYDDALFVGQRIWRRDLLTDDSVLVYQDTLVPRYAAAYARAHPDAEPLGPDDDAPDEPSSSVTSDIDVVDVAGPYLSYSYHADVQREGRPGWHVTRRGVVDLRGAHEATVADIFGQQEADRALRQARRSYEAVLDSVLRSPSEGARRMAEVLGDFHLDSMSFELTSLGDAPAVIFHAPGQGGGTAGSLTLPLSPIRLAPGPWWNDLSSELPGSAADASVDEWRHDGLRVIAHYDTSGDAADLTLRDSTRREWRVGRIAAPVHRIYWLDGQRLDTRARHSLAHAFDEAALYDETVRTAAMREDVRGSASGVRRVRAELLAPKAHLVTSRSSKRSKR